MTASRRPVEILESAMLRDRRQYSMKFTKAAILAVTLAVPAMVFAQAPAAPAASKKAASTAKASVASHSTAGTVKTSSDTQLVITKGSGKNAKDETFTVNASTKKEGDIATGSHVTV